MRSNGFLWIPKKYINFLNFYPQSSAIKANEPPLAPLRPHMWGGRTHAQTVKLRRFREHSGTEFVPGFCRPTQNAPGKWRQTTHFAPQPEHATPSRPGHATYPHLCGVSTPNGIIVGTRALDYIHATTEKWQNFSRFKLLIYMIHRANMGSISSPYLAFTPWARAVPIGLAVPTIGGVGHIPGP